MQLCANHEVGCFITLKYKDKDVFWMGKYIGEHDNFLIYIDLNGYYCVINLQEVDFIKLKTVTCKGNKELKSGKSRKKK